MLDYVGEHATRMFAEDGVIVVEHHRKKDLKEEFGSLKRYRMLKQGDSCVSFYESS